MVAKILRILKSSHTCSSNFHHFREIRGNTKGGRRGGGKEGGKGGEVEAGGRREGGVGGEKEGGVVEQEAGVWSVAPQ